MRSWLVVYLLSSGIYFEPHSSAESCNDAMIEARLVKGEDLWSGVCVEPEQTKFDIVRSEVEP